MQITVECEMMYYTKQYTLEWVSVEAYDVYQVRVYIVLNKCLWCSSGAVYNLHST
jgi:hypothetical protein